MPQAAARGPGYTTIGSSFAHLLGCRAPLVYNGLTAEISLKPRIEILRKTFSVVNYLLPLASN
jgi:hypothetical protein